jgi:predicted adenylyl cyclase CyaB
MLANFGATSFLSIAASNRFASGWQELAASANELEYHYRHVSAPPLNRKVRPAPMARNIEIKARIESVESVAPKAAALAKAGPIEIAQDDTFFRCEAGRLKLRVLSSDSAELIFYRRANQRGPQESFYLRSPSAAPDSLRECLSLAYGQIGRVRKQRPLFLVDRTRLHLDRVEGLGHFLELEVPLAEDEPAEFGIREAVKIMEKLGVEPAQLVKGAYLDLLAVKGM